MFIYKMFAVLEASQNAVFVKNVSVRQIQYYIKFEERSAKIFEDFPKMLLQDMLIIRFTKGTKV